MNTKILITLFIASVTLLSFIPMLDAHAMEVHNLSFERSVEAFGIAKALNAVISLIQGTQLSFTPIGVGFSFSVGEILDPLNDLVERFSMIMLLSSISLGIQKLLLMLSFSSFIKVSLSLSAVALIVLFWLNKQAPALMLNILLRLFSLLIILRFSAMIFVSIEAGFYDNMLKEEFDTSTVVLTKTHKELKKIQASEQNISKIDTTSSSIFSSSTRKYEQIKAQMNISKRLEQLEKNIEEAQGYIVNLATIFIVLSMVLPMLFLWFVYALIKSLFSRNLFFRRLQRELVIR